MPRTTLTLAAVLTAILTAACSDSGVEIATKGAAALAIVSGDKQTGNINAALSEPLVVRVTTGSGAVVSGVTVNFEVTSGAATVSPASATTDILGLAQTTVTLSATAGSVVVKATVATNSALSATFTATATTPPVTSCTSSSIRTMAIGDVATITSPPVCLTPGNSTGEFALVAHNQSTSFGVNASLSLQPAGLSAPSSTASIAPATPPSFSLASLAGARTRRDWTAPAVERSALAARIPEARATYRARNARFSVAPAVSAAVAIGDIVSLNANANEGCTNIQKRAGRVVAISNRAIIVADTANPTGGFTTTEYESFANTFDSYIDPTDRTNFGDPTDIDNNGHVIIFFTRAVNALTPKNANYYIGGFFYSRDLYPLTTTNGLTGCAGSNQGEMFYLMVPDPNGVVNGNTFSKSFVTSATIAIVAHEYEHLINASRRLYVNTAVQDFEETWLDEGLAHIAEELLFYARSGLTPRHDIDATLLRSSQTYVNLFNDDGVDNFGRLMEWMAKPTANSPYAPFDSLATRGAAWSFLRHAADHRSASEASTWQALVNSTTTGMANIGNVFGGNVQTLFRQWAVANITDDITTIPAEYQQPSWSYKTIIPLLTTNKTTYPLTTVTWTNGTPSTVSLVGGGAAYWRFSLAAGATGVFSTSAIPANVTLTVARLR